MYVLAVSVNLREDKVSNQTLSKYSEVLYGHGASGYFSPLYLAPVFHSRIGVFKKNAHTNEHCESQTNNLVV